MSFSKVLFLATVLFISRPGYAQESKCPPPPPSQDALFSCDAVDWVKEPGNPSFHKGSNYPPEEQKKYVSKLESTCTARNGNGMNVDFPIPANHEYPIFLNDVLKVSKVVSGPEFFTGTRYKFGTRYKTYKAADSCDKKTGKSKWPVEISSTVTFETDGVSNFIMESKSDEIKAKDFIPGHWKKMDFGFAISRDPLTGVNSIKFLSMTWNDGSEWAFNKWAKKQYDAGSIEKFAGSRDGALKVIHEIFMTGNTDSVASEINGLEKPMRVFQIPPLDPLPPVK